MTTILSIQSTVAYGHVGNSAAVFPMQRLGVEVWPVATVHFSNHTGYGLWRGPLLAADDVAGEQRCVDVAGERLDDRPAIGVLPGAVEDRHAVAAAKHPGRTEAWPSEPAERRPQEQCPRSDQHGRRLGAVDTGGGGGDARGRAAGGAA